MKKILILDDEKQLLELWTMQIKMWGIEADVFTAENGLEGLSLIKQEKKFDLIITDFMMPKMDGLDFVKHVRAADTETPVCFFTGYLPELAFLADEMEKVMFFEKPMISRQMQLYIKSLLTETSQWEHLLG